MTTVTLPIRWTTFESTPAKLKTHKSKMVTTIVAIKENNATFEGLLKNFFIVSSFLFIGIERSLRWILK